MLNEFNNYIAQHHLCCKDDAILIAVSGGADSVALLHLFNAAGYNIALAHCNFNLRGLESDGDEAFVRELASTYKIVKHFISFDTKAFASQNKLSIEMAARELRYTWFNKLCQEHNYTKIATGHHINDSIETLFINLTRGTGINGLTGIKPLNNILIRPLLFTTREQIEAYIHSEELNYRTDSSNASNEFVRNIIRNQIIPAFKTINPAFETTMQGNMERFSQAASIYNEQINDIRDRIYQTDKAGYKIDIQKLIALPYPETILFEILSPLKFSFDTVTNILKIASHEPGRTFVSPTHKLLIDREFIIIEEINGNETVYELHSLNDFSNLPINIKTQLLNIKDFILSKSSLVASLDADKIFFPLVLRKWKKGDSFYPIGMKNKKKLSDFFIDQKIDRFTKEKTWILEANGKIVWLVGLRIDDRFKVSAQTQNIIQLTLQP